MSRRSTLRKARLWAGETQYSLAEKVGIKEHDISRYETGRADPMPSVALRIAKVLNTEIEKLFPEMIFLGVKHEN